MKLTDNDSHGMEQPRYPTSGDEDTPRPTGWGPRLVIGAVVVTLTILIFVHVTGIIGPGLH